MQHPVSDFVVNQFSNNLQALRGILLKAQQHAGERKFDENLFLQLRLAPDMFPFVKQIQIACDVSKGAVARLSGKTAPAFADDEKTLVELIARIDKTLGFIREFKSEDFKDYAAKKISFPWYPGKELSGDDYLVSYAIPNFYFHITTAYAMLRQGGVNLGKGDFLGQINWKNV